VGAAREAARRGESPKPKKTLCRDCGLGYKYQQSACDMLVTHVHGEVAPGVITQSSKAWEELLYTEGRPGSF